MAELFRKSFLYLAVITLLTSSITEAYQGNLEVKLRKVSAGPTELASDYSEGVNEMISIWKKSPEAIAYNKDLQKMTPTRKSFELGLRMGGVLYSCSMEQASTVFQTVLDTYSFVSKKIIPGGRSELEETILAVETNGIIDSTKTFMQNLPQAIKSSPETAKTAIVAIKVAYEKTAESIVKTFDVDQDSKCRNAVFKLMDFVSFTSNSIAKEFHDINSQDIKELVKKARN